MSNIEKEVQNLRETVFTLQQYMQQMEKRLSHLEDHSGRVCEVSTQLSAILHLDPALPLPTS
jgi:prefoldin subunit 5